MVTLCILHWRSLVGRLLALQVQLPAMQSACNCMHLPEMHGHACMLHLHRLVGEVMGYVALQVQRHGM